jgi:DNA repair exonuclease SbcCD nuclease subunit
VAKHLLYSDIHLRPERLKDILHCLDIIGDAAVKHEVVKSGGFVFNGGDTFNERGVIKTSCFDSLYKKRVEWAKKNIKHVDNIGNHDQEDKLGLIHPMGIFRQFGWHVADQPFYHVPETNFWVVPYQAPHGISVETLEKVPENSILIIHAGIADAFKSKKCRDEDGIPAAYFKKFKAVFSGHYHLHHTLKPCICYIGSPLQKDFGEIGNDCGYVIYDDKKNIYEHHLIEGIPRHFVIEIDEKTFKRKTKWECGEEDIIEVKLRGSEEFVKSVTKESLFDRGIIGLKKVTRDIAGSRAGRIVISSEDEKNNDLLIQKYVDYQLVVGKMNNLEKTKLMTVGREIMNAKL